jgi:hypothetical protein
MLESHHTVVQAPCQPMIPLQYVNPTLDSRSPAVLLPPRSRAFQCTPLHHGFTCRGSDHVPPSSVRLPHCFGSTDRDPPSTPEVCNQTHAGVTQGGVEACTVRLFRLERSELTHQSNFDFAQHDGTTELHEFTAFVAWHESSMRFEQTDDFLRRFYQLPLEETRSRLVNHVLDKRQEGFDGVQQFHHLLVVLSGAMLRGRW